MSVISSTHLEFLLQGAMWTVVLSALSFLTGGLVGMLVALMRVSSSPWVRHPASVYVQTVQGTPLLVILFLTYFGLPTLGLTVSSLFAAIVSLTIYVGAFLGEIWRGAIQSVPRAQWEAAECLAMSRLQRMAYVILPQAIRIATPPTVGFMVQIVKNTSLVSVVGFIELSRAAQLINNSIFEPFIVYLIVAALYFVMCFPLSLYSQRLEANVGYAPSK